MDPTWNHYHFVVQMPHMAPGEKLSEVEMLKLLAAYQWESIARALGQRPSQIESLQGDRLYGSVIDVEFHLGQRHSMEILGEDAEIHVRNQVRFFAKKFVEGLFVIDDRPIPDSTLDAIKSREDLRATGASFACMTNAFIARGAGNARLRVFSPAGVEEVSVPELREPPEGIREQGRVQKTGELAEPGEGDWLPLADCDPRPVRYPIVRESDLNGAGLVYFARYEAMMNYGERLFLCEHLERPVSTELVAHLSTEHRRAYFFANANPSDDVLVYVRAAVQGPEGFAAPDPRVGYRVPLKMRFRIDLYRSSDLQLMASSVVRKSLNVPGHQKAVLAEADRLLRGLAGGSAA